MRFLTIGIPTYGRDEVLVQTVENVLRHVDGQAMEVIVADQTPVHEPQTVARLQAWAKSGQVKSSSGSNARLCREPATPSCSRPAANRNTVRSPFVAQRGAGRKEGGVSGNG